MKAKKSIFTTEFNVLGTGKVKTLIELLAKYKDKLPEELNNKLKELVDCDVFEYDANYFIERGFGSGLSVFADGIEHKNVVSINPILMTLTHMNDCNKTHFEFCNITHDGKSILTIGDRV